MVFVHHTDTTNSYSCSSSAQIVRGIYAYHVLSLGWNDIGYNFLIDRCGRIFEGRYGGMTRPVVGAQTGGFNWETAGIAMIGTFNTVRPTSSALWSLERLIAWRLDVAHVNPLSTSLMTSSGNNPEYPAGHKLWLRNVSGHRDGYPTACPGNALYRAASGDRPRCGFDRPAQDLPPDDQRPHPPHGAGNRRSDHLPCSVQPCDHLAAPGEGTAGGDGRNPASGTAPPWPGRGRGSAANLPPGAYHWTLTAPGARGVSMSLGSLAAWVAGRRPGCLLGTTTGGNLESLLKIDGNTLDVAGAPAVLATTNHVRINQPELAAAREVGVRFTATTAGHRRGRPGLELHGERLGDGGDVLRGRGRSPMRGGARPRRPQQGRWDASSGSVEMRARYVFQTPTRVDEAHTLVVD